MGVYFSLLAYQNDVLRKALFLSPVVNMERIIENMMLCFDVTLERLQKEAISLKLKIIHQSIGIDILENL